MARKALIAAGAALCLFATLHWTRLVVPSPGGRAVTVTLIATAGAAGMGALSTGIVRAPRRAIFALQAVLILATLALTLMAIGLPASYLAPATEPDAEEAWAR